MTFIISFLAKIIDPLKIKMPRIWALIGAAVIALETMFVAKPWAWMDHIPNDVTIFLTALVGLFLNASSFSLAQQVIGDEQASPGKLVDIYIAKAVEAFKSNSLGGFAILQSLFAALKFYIVSDPNLALPGIVVNLILSIAMVLSVPKTKPTLVKIGKIPDAGLKAAA